MIINQFNDIVFLLDSTNTYARGVGVYIIAGMGYVLLFIFLINSRKEKKHIDGKLLSLLFSLAIIPFVGTTFQIIFYGISLIWPMFALVVIFGFVFIERDEMLKDELTGLSTRGQLENRLKYKLKRQLSFTLIMMDMNDFKHINDNYGHDEGDTAIKTISSILNHCVKREDMVCRYGGDEFMILVESESKCSGALIVDRIKEHLEIYNNKKIKPYPLKMSFGYEFVDASKAIKVLDILASVDGKMYKDKRKFK